MVTMNIEFLALELATAGCVIGFPPSLFRKYAGGPSIVPSYRVIARQLAQHAGRFPYPSSKAGDQDMFFNGICGGRAGIRLLVI